jgi:(2R)-3-sulfolactate dehydrogenase (NADP+)
MPVLPLSELRPLAQAVLVRAGASDANAACVSEALVAAEADGLPSHGLARLPDYAAQLRSGKIDGKAVPTIEQVAAAALRVDAAHGFAQPAIDLGIRAALALAPRAGIVGAAITHSYHCGVAGHPAERIARSGCIGLVFSNTPAAIAPWGGRRALLGTNPIAFACPRGAKPPIVIDLSLSRAARGKILLARQQGATIPEDWAFDENGIAATDPQRALRGSMQAAGGAKGVALALMVELLAAALTGSTLAFEASSFYSDQGAPPGVGQLVMVIDPRAFSAGLFSERVEALATAVLGEGTARLPGDRRIEARERAAREGVEVPDTLYDELARLAGPAGTA